MKIGDWLKAHKPEAGIGAAGIVVTLALYVRSKSNASAGSSGTTTTATGALPTSVADTSGTDVASGFESQILGLQQAVLGLATGPAASSGSTPVSTSGAVASVPALDYSTEVFGGSGFSAPSGSIDVETATGDYSMFTNPDAAGAYGRSGGALYFQPAQGVEELDTAQSNLAPGTPLFAKAST